MKSIETFKDVRDYLNILPYINSGGCGVAALAMYEWLKKNKNITSTIVYLYRGSLSSTYNNNNEILNNNKDIKYVDSCSHACIVYKNKYIDCQKIVNTSNYKNRHYIRDIDFVKASIKADQWNNMFDRRHVPDIEKTLGIELIN